MFQSLVVEVSCSGSELIELVCFVAVEGFIDEDHSILCRTFIGGLQRIGEPGQGLVLRYLSAPFSLH